ncbi:MAG: 2-C-methyl-D-erythritol 4-phosphate cytidylyltransferase [Candidatus Margulisiibacteriota bacterium]
MRLALIITAAGSGTRFGGDIHKLLLQWKGKSVLAHSCSAFFEFPFEETIVTADADRVTQFQSQLSDLTWPFPFRVISGGTTRFESVKKAVQTLSPGIDGVLIHDAARPNVSPDLIDRIVQKTGHCRALIPVSPVVDTIKLIENGIVKETLPREKLFHVQTPQAFHVAELKRAYQTVQGDFTDEAGLLERAGVPVIAVPGDAQNLKITYPEDIARLNAFSK